MLRHTVQRHPVVWFYVLTMFISWGGFYGCYLFLASSFSFLTETITPGMPVAFSLVGILVSYGPSIAGLIVTGICFGHSGVDEWFGRWTQWRVALRWYVVALLCAPVLFVFQHLITYPQAFVHRMFFVPTWRELRDV